MSSINFSNPYLLLIGIPFILAIIIPFFIAIRKGSFRIQNIVSLVLHLIISVLITLVIAKMTLEIVVTETNVYVVADVSYTNHENLSKTDETIQNLKRNLPKNSKMGVVCFGKDYEVLTELGEKVDSVTNSKVDDSQTDIASALEYTATLFKPAVIKRIVLITDGNTIKSSKLVGIVNSLEQQDIYVDAIYIDNNLNPSQKEVQINSVDFHTSTFMGKEEAVMVLIQSTIAAPATLYLDDGSKVSQKRVQLSVGLNTETLELDTTTPGVKNYSIRIETTEDTSTFNNTYLCQQEVNEKVKMLFISGNAKDEQIAQRVYGNTSEIDYYINNPNVPYSLEDLALYDEYVLSNIDIRTLRNTSQFISNLDIMVSEFGKSLITLGNTYVQNQTDENLIKLSNMLPVTYGENKNDSKLFTLVLDVSRSMEMASKLIMAKSAACAMLDLLKPNDWVMVIAFWGDHQMVQSAVPVSKKEDVKQVIKNLKPAQGTMMTGALELAEKELVAQTGFDKKEIFLISDGKPYGGTENNRAVAERIKSKGITISTLNTSSNDGADLLTSIAGIGGGNYYYIEKEEDLANLIDTEIADNVTETVIEGIHSEVIIKRRKDEVVADIDLLPQIRGFYYNQAKANSTTVLTASYNTNVHTYEVPIYTHWNYGTGHVASLASDISTYWMSEWQEGTTGEQFLKNTLIANMPNQRIDSPFIIDVNINEIEAELSVYVPNVNSRATVSMNITHPDGSSTAKTLAFNSVNYVTSFELNQIGNYQIDFTYQIGNVKYQNDRTFQFSYFLEYDSFQVFTESNLNHMITSNGQVSTDGNLSLENDDSLIQTYVYDFTVLWMVLAIVLFVADIIIRKVRLQDIKALFIKQDKKKD